jgi:hypothetical protein
VSGETCDNTQAAFLVAFQACLPKALLQTHRLCHTFVGPEAVVGQVLLRLTFLFIFAKPWKFCASLQDNRSVTLLLPAAGDTLQPFCPALGASIMGRHMMSIGSNQNFSTPISVLDAFGSKARSGPGSNWIVALSQNSGDARQLSGNMRGALSGGYVVLQGLSIQAEPGSRLNLTLSAVPPPGSGDKVRTTCGITCHANKPSWFAVLRLYLFLRFTAVLHDDASLRPVVRKLPLT